MMMPLPDPEPDPELEPDPEPVVPVWLAEPDVVLPLPLVPLA